MPFSFRPARHLALVAGVLSFASLLTACNKGGANGNFAKTKSGVEYKIFKNVGGKYESRDVVGGEDATYKERLGKVLAVQLGHGEAMLAPLSGAELGRIARHLQEWSLTPVGSEGYRTAEVTLGGVDTDALDGRTMEAKAVPGLYFVGEVVDVTGWLGGYNFQWAWASGMACGLAA